MRRRRFPPVEGGATAPHAGPVPEGPVIPGQGGATAPLPGPPPDGGEGEVPSQAAVAPAALFLADSPGRRTIDGIAGRSGPIDRARSVRFSGFSGRTSPRAARARNRCDRCRSVIRILRFPAAALVLRTDFPQIRPQIRAKPTNRKALPNFPGMGDGFAGRSGQFLRIISIAGLALC